MDARYTRVSKRACETPDDIWVLATASLGSQVLILGWPSTSKARAQSALWLPPCLAAGPWILTLLVPDCDGISSTRDHTGIIRPADRPWASGTKSPTLNALMYALHRTSIPRASTLSSRELSGMIAGSLASLGELQSH